MKHYLVIAGNIGVGKSTLAKILYERLGWEPFYEAVVDNPYLADFYADMPRWAFQSQMFFLTKRLHAHHQLLSRPEWWSRTGACMRMLRFLRGTCFCKDA